VIGSKAAAIEVEEEKTSIDSGPTANAAWEDNAADDAGTNSRHDVGMGTVDEPTVEDQARPLPPLSLVPPLPKTQARPIAAKLHVVSGNDTGRDFPLDPARTLTVGRAIDNDVVLTDIAVSRKHLDLSYDGSFWVLRDRGSGNGTLVNDRIEDGSCRLLHGDRIEIGNTVFQLDHPAAAAEAPQVGWGQRDDDDEAATVAGRGQRPQSAPEQARPEPRAEVPRPAAKLPPPTRARTTSAPPPIAAQHTAPIPTAALAARPRRATASAQLPIPSSVPVAVPSGPVTDAAAIASDPFEIAALVTAPPRHLTTTARVEPRALAQAPARYPFIVKPPSPTRRYAAYAGIAAGILLVGVIAKFASGPAAPPTEAAAVIEPSMSPPTSAGTGAPRAIAGSGSVAVVVPAGSAGTGAEQPAPPPPPMIAPTPAPVPAPPPVAEVRVVVPAPQPAAVPVPAPMPAMPPTRLAPEAPHTPPPPTRTTPPPITPAVHTAPRTPPSTRTTPPPTRTAPPPTRTAPPPTRTAPATHATPPPARPDEVVAVKSVAAARKKAGQQYAASNFDEAATIARAAAEIAPPTEAASLRALATDYTTVGAAMATAGATIETYAAYGRALAADRRVGGEHGATIRERLGQLAPKAAASYMAKSNYEAAKHAADTAADFGSGSNATVVQVRQSLERKAGEFYATGTKLLKGQPEDAKALFRRILKMVAPDSPTYQKAYQALNTRTRAADDDE
jgi:hypothetical protein